MLIGIGGILCQEWKLGNQIVLMMIPAGITLYLGIFLNWEKKRQSVYVVGVLSALIVICFLGKKEISGSIAASWKRLLIGN